MAALIIYLVQQNIIPNIYNINALCIYTHAWWDWRPIRCRESSLYPHVFFSWLLRCCSGSVLFFPILQPYFCLFLFRLTEYASAVLVTGLRKKDGEKIVTPKNSSPMAHHCGLFAVGHAAIYTCSRACEVAQVLHLAFLDHWLQQELESCRDHVSVPARTHRFTICTCTHTCSK